MSEPGASRDHTERMLRAAGVEVRSDGGAVTVAGGQQVGIKDWIVPGDFSSAAFLVAGALLLDGSELTIERVGLNPTRTGALEVLARMGADITTTDTTEECGEPLGSLVAKASDLVATEVSDEEVPRLIDELPVLAVLATQARGVSRFRGAQELRVKESDRIEAMVAALNAMGADMEALPDGMVVRGPSRLVGTEVDARGDHRIALALAVAGFVAEGNVRIIGWSSVETSFPEFLDVLAEARSAK